MVVMQKLLALAALLCVARIAAQSEYLDLLGVEAEALQSLDEAELKKLYKRRALELHPDKSDHPDAAGRFRRLQEAYEALKEPSTRSFFARFARYGGDVWRDVKTYADERLSFERRGWQRTRQGMRMASERVTLKDDFARAKDGHVLPLEERYARKALGEHGGVWVVYVCDQEDRKACASLSKVVEAFAKRVKGYDWLRVAAVNAAVESNRGWVDALGRDAGAGDRRNWPAVFVLPPLPWAAEGRAWDRYVDAEPVDCEPHNNLPMRLARVAKWLRDSRVPLLDTSPDQRGCSAADRTCAAVDETTPMATLLVDDGMGPHVLRALRVARAKYAPLFDVSLATCFAGDGKAACAAERGGFPRLGVEHRGEPAFWLELADDRKIDDAEAAVRLRHALAGIYAARRASLTPRASRALAVDGLGDIKDPCAMAGFDGNFKRMDGLYFGKPAWKRGNVLVRWHPGSSRNRGNGAWLITDHETMDRAWGYLEADVMLPLSNASANCWTFYCHSTKEWTCQPHVSIKDLS